jgi:N4-gp56 family major capsid protein
MAQVTWTFDLPTGTFKNHAMSKRLYRAALAESIFADHVTTIDGFGKKMGESVTLTRVAALTQPASAVLIETERIPEDVLTLSTTAITVNELGRSVPFTSFANDLSEFDLENPIQRALKEQQRLELDRIFAVAFKAAKVKYTPTGAAAATITTNGTFGATATVNMNVFHLEEIYDYMYDTLFVPTLANDDYIGIFRTLGIRGIMRDPTWTEWHKYTDPQAKYNGEVGRLEGIRLLTTNNANALAKVGTASVLGEGVVFGEDSVALAEVLSPELRAAIPSDYGRAKGVAWYAILQAGLIWDTGNAGQARVVHVGSA